FSARAALASVAVSAVAAIRHVRFFIDRSSRFRLILCHLLETRRGVGRKVYVRATTRDQLREKPPRPWPGCKPDMMMTESEPGAFDPRNGSDHRNGVGRRGTMPHPFRRIAPGNVRHRRADIAHQQVERRPRRRRVEPAEFDDAGQSHPAVHWRGDEFRRCEHDGRSWHVARLVQVEMIAAFTFERHDESQLSRQCARPDTGRDDHRRAVDGFAASTYPDDSPVPPHDVADLSTEDASAARFDMPGQSLDVAHRVRDAPVPAKPNGEIEVGMQEPVVPAQSRAVEFLPAKAMLPADGPTKSIGLEPGTIMIGVEIVAWADERLAAGSLGKRLMVRQTVADQRKQRVGGAP